VTLYARLAVLAVILAALAGGAWKAYVMGKNTVKAEWNASIALANETARETERLNQKSKEIALENRTREILANVAAADRARVASDSLRDTSRRSVETARDTPAACIVSVDTHAELLGLCQAEYRALAEKADGHAADVKALTGAWPR
jgi:hypothetical protein